MAVVVVVEVSRRGSNLIVHVALVVVVMVMAVAVAAYTMLKFENISSFLRFCTSKGGRT